MLKFILVTLLSLCYSLCLSFSPIITDLFQPESSTYSDENSSIIGLPYHLSIQSVGLHSEFHIGDHSQDSVDKHDIVFTKDIYDFDGTIRFLGHNTRSFSALCNVTIGDIIYITDDKGNQHSYRVVVSEAGNITQDRVNIKSVSSEENLLGLGYVEFITCYNDSGNRWVVLCEEMS